MHLVSQDGEHASLLALRGEVDLETVEPLRHALATLAARPGEAPVVVDLSAVRFADTALINVLLQARLRLGDRLRIAAPSALVERLLYVLGLDHVFIIRDCREAAARG
ncbi:STAS domain-containing protein [Streptomyces flavidovirens]|uniref:STAS domain-containing protein n=1 Tax=Streptomyces flavidovirens TaxID=67298 RepID=UPI000996C7F6|nr:STAS domain-containing protein [Streptomyces flavidovirens]